MYQEKKRKEGEYKNTSSKKEDNLLKIDSVDSEHEREANDTALRVIHGDQLMGESSLPKDQIMGGGNHQEGMISMKGMQMGEGGMVAPDHMKQNIEGTKGSGDQLPEEAKRVVRGKTAWDLDNVRIHTDGNAAELAKGMNAKAFT